MASIYKIKSSCINENIILECANEIKKGNVIIYPSDTCYMLSSFAFDEKASSKIFEIKKRDKNKAFSILVKDIEMIKSISDISDKDIEILKSKLPGRYTFLLKKRNDINYYCTGNSDKIGIRIMDFLPAQKLCEQVGKPIITTSANLSNYPSPYSVEEIYEQYGNSIGDKVSVIVNIGELPKNDLSTLIDLTDNNKIIKR